MKRIILTSALVATLLLLDGLQLNGSLQALAQGGGTGGAANNGSRVTGKEKDASLSAIVDIGAIAIGHFIGKMFDQGLHNTLTSGTWEGHANHVPDGGGNSTAGGWGGEKP